MKKRAMTLGISAVILIALIAVYFFVGNENKEEDMKEDPTANLVYLTQKAREDIDRAIIRNSKGEIDFAADRTGDIRWNVSGSESLKLDDSLVSVFMRTAAELRGRKLEEAGSPEEYGLNNSSSAEIHFTDGNVVNIKVGKRTPDEQYYYASVDGKDGIYLIDMVEGRRFEQSLNDLIDHKAKTIDTGSLKEIYIKKQGEEALKYYEGYPKGIEYITRLSPSLISPEDGILLAKASINTILGPLGALQFDEIISLNDNNLEEYGLLAPSLEISLKTEKDELNFLIGKEAEGNKVYFKYASEPYIYTIDKSLVLPVMQMKKDDLLSKQLSFVDIAYVEKAVISALDKKYEIIPNYYEEVKGDVKSAAYKPTINNKPVNETEYKKYYEILKLMPWDGRINDFEASGEPAAVIKYYAEIPAESINKEINDGRASDLFDRAGERKAYEVEIQFYNYNENYYAVKRSGFEDTFLVNKRHMKDIVERTELLMEKGE